MPAEMRFIVKENIIRGMYDNGNLMIYAAADGVKDNKNSCVCSECVSEKGEKKYDYLMPVNLRIILMYVNNECDKYEYDGSPMFDELPDKRFIDGIVERVLKDYKNNEKDNINFVDKNPDLLIYALLSGVIVYRKNRHACISNNKLFLSVRVNDVDKFNFENQRFVRSDSTSGS